MKIETIPSLDLNDFLKGDENKRKISIKLLEKVLRNMAL